MFFVTNICTTRRVPRQTYRRPVISPSALSTYGTSAGHHARDTGQCPTHTQCFRNSDSDRARGRVQPNACLRGGGIPLDVRRDLHITLLPPLPLFSVVWDASPLSTVWCGLRGSAPAPPGTGPSLQHIPLSYCWHGNVGVVSVIFLGSMSHQEAETSKPCIGVGLDFSSFGGL